MNRLFAVVALAVAPAVTSTALAQNPMTGPIQSNAPFIGSREPKPLDEPARTYRAEVRGLDKVAGTVTLRHSAIDILGVPGGTKEYEVKDGSMLERVKVGDPVRFNAVLQGRSLLITYIAPAN